MSTPINLEDTSKHRDKNIERLIEQIKEKDAEIERYKVKYLNCLDQKHADGAEASDKMLALEEKLRAARVAAIKECIICVEYHQNLPFRNNAFKAACRDILISLNAATARIERGEDFNPSTPVCSNELDDKDST